MIKSTYFLCTLIDNGISGSLIWSKTLMELVFNHFGEFRWSLERPISQIHSPHLHAGSSGIFSDLLRSVQMLKREWGAESNWKPSHLFIPGKTAALVPEFTVEDLPLAELQLWFLRVQWRTCPWAEHSMMMMMIFDKIYFYFLNYANIYSQEEIILKLLFL